MHPGSAGFIMCVMNAISVFIRAIYMQIFNRVLDSAVATVSEEKERNQR